MTTETARLLETFREADVLEALDVQFALAMTRMTGEADRPAVALGAALACRAPRLGHVFADLHDTAAVRVEPRSARWSDREEARLAFEHLPWPGPDTWVRAMRESALTEPGGPLVLEGSRLYLHRYWEYQQALGRALALRAASPPDVDLTLCREALWRLFPKNAAGPEPSDQRLAAAVAALAGLAVITGGPGTGKTTTVTRLLALLVEHAEARGQRLRIALAAPTGKAAARMAESIRDGRDALDTSDEVKARIVPVASTIHRLLGFQRARPTQFRHHAGNPLPYDVLVVDEASMIPLALMAKLVDAVPRRARLVLLGDADQLASVEAGAVLGDLCPPPGRRVEARSRALAAALDALDVTLPAGAVVVERPPGLGDCVVRLRHSFRFDASGGIGRLAAEINAGRSRAALDLLGRASASEDDELLLVEGVDVEELRARLRTIVLDRHHPVTTAGNEAAALERLGRFCVLCAHRRGPLGAATLNEEIQRWLVAAGRLVLDGDWYAGRPVMVTQNDYHAGLFNGDIGVILPQSDASAPRRAIFPASDEPGWRAVSPGRLPAHETVFAMTVHKSQGSEFDEVVVVLPTRPSPVLTRELLYTAITRARKRVIVVGPRSVIERGIEQQVQRASGLREMLWT